MVVRLCLYFRGRNFNRGDGEPIDVLNDIPIELSHEPVPARDGGKEFVPRWPQDRAKVDPYRRPGY